MLLDYCLKFSRFKDSGGCVLPENHKGAHKDIFGLLWRISKKRP